MKLLPWRSLLLAALALIFAATPGAFTLLQYERDGVLRGELWRLLTAHLVHASSYHLIWDVLPLIALGFLFEGLLGKRFWGVMGVSSLAVGGGLLLLAPHLDTYCGLSGVLNGLWVGGALVAARREASAGNPGLALLYRLCVLGDLGKVALEAATGSPLFTDATALGGTPVPLAHALGALAGVLCAWRGSRPEEPGAKPLRQHAPAMAVELG